MLSFECPRCSLKKLSVEEIHCFNCDSKATTNNVVDENFEIRQQEMATSRDTGAASGSRKIFQNWTQTSTVIGINGKRNEAKDGMIEDNQTHQQCRKEVCATSNKGPSPLCKTGKMNTDFLLEICTETVHKASDNSNSVETQNEFLNVKKHQSCNQVKQGLCSLDKMVLLTVNDDTESNISTPQCSQTQNTPGKMTDFEVSSAENLQFLNDTLAVQGPSDLLVNEHGPNLIGDNLHSCSSSKVQSVQHGRDKRLTCNVCDVEIHEHAEIRGGTYLYFCCVCKYTTRSQAYLRIHSDVHCAQKVCNLCSKEYRDGNLHESEHTCNACGIKFGCKTLLDQHSVEHEKYFLDHCRVCGQKFLDHFTKKNGRKIYLCCACNFRSKGIIHVKEHNNMHRPKLFCMICREEYPIKEKDLHDRKWTCIVCGIEFKCKTLLEDHSVDHKDYYSSNCRICNETIEKHYFKFENEYKCCFCENKWLNIQELQRHLYSHTTLRLFKCEWCQSRFYRSGELLTHSQICIPLPYKCKKCSARFPCSVSHDKHLLEKHGQTQTREDPA